MSMYIIYRAINDVNGKSYIGLTSKSLLIRKRQHIEKSYSNESPCLIHKAIKKHGTKSFHWVVLDVAKTVTEACNLERTYITEYDTFGINGYNLTNGGEGVKEVSESTNRKEKSFL